MKPNTPRRILISTALAGLAAAIFVAAARYYEIRKGRAEVARADAAGASPGRPACT